MKPYRLIARHGAVEYATNTDARPVIVGDIRVGEGTCIIAGPCTVHSREQTIEIAIAVKQAGAHMLRGGAYKPRTIPHDFQGLGEEGLRILAEARAITGLPIVTEVLDQHHIAEVGRVADVLQIGSRNAQNYALLRDVARYARETGKAVLLKNGMSMVDDDMLCAAEYLAHEDFRDIILCERGTASGRLAERMGHVDMRRRLGVHASAALASNPLRNTPDYQSVQVWRENSYLPVIGDPSHSSGRADLVPAVADNYLDAGAHGLIVEVRRDDEPRVIDGENVCDYDQSLTATDFRNYMDSLREKGLLK